MELALVRMFAVDLIWFLERLLESFGCRRQRWLIDFDRGEQRAVSSAWQQANIARLLRSFEKEKNNLPVFHWTKEDWNILLEGYSL